MNAVERTLAKMSFSGKHKVRIMRQIQRLIKAGVPLATTLDTLWQMYSKNGKKPKEPLAMMIKQWRDRLNQGKSLAEAMHGWISLPEELIVEAGEQSEKLADALDDALKAEGASKQIRKAIIGGLAYPVVLLLALVFILVGFSYEIVPTFASLLPVDQWTGAPATMYAVSQFVTNWLAVIGIVFGGLVTAAFLSLPILTGPTRKFFDYLPPWSIYKIIQGASFMIAMRGFIAAGVPVPDALRKINMIGNGYMRERVNAILTKINMGRNLGQAMQEAGHNFPDYDIAGEISIYADLDDFDTSLDLLAKEWIDGSVEKAQASSKAINNVMLFLIAGTIAMIASTMFSLQDAIAQSVQ